MGTVGYYRSDILCRVICEREDGRHSRHPAVKGGGVSLVNVHDYSLAISAAAEKRDAVVLGVMHTQLETLEQHARKVKDDTGKLRQLTALRIWNLYHLGQVLNEICPHGGPRAHGVILQTLNDYGISPRLSIKSRRIAAMDTEDIRVFIDESGDEINLPHLLKLHTESTSEPPLWNEDANWRMVQSVVRDYVSKTENEDRWNIARDFLKASRELED